MPLSSVRILWVGVAALAPGAFAQTPPAAPATAAPAQEAPKRDPKSVDYERAVKDLKRIEAGDFVFYQRRKDVLLELPESRLGQIFLLQGTFGSGVDSFGLQAGFPVVPGDSFRVDAFRWERTDETVSIVRPNLRFRWDAKDPLAIASERSFPEAYVGSYRIEQSDPEKKLLLLNVSPLFYGDALKLQEIVSGTLGGPYQLDRDRSNVESIKGYPDNTVIQMRLHFQSPRGPQAENPLAALLGIRRENHLEDPRSAPLRVTMNLWYRKDTGYRPRLADPRVGFFTEDFYSVGRFFEQDRTERFINRFQLAKKDPKADASEAVKPIVWTIDPSIPPKWRPAVREGILRWNKAYEAIGFKNAVQVQDPPKEGYDHADGRFNVIRMTMSPDAGYAVALARSDPFTGEVLNAGVTLDANMLAITADEHEFMVQPGPGGRQMAEKALLRCEDGCANDLRLADGARAAAFIRNVWSRNGWSAVQCNYAAEKAANVRQAWLGVQAMGATIGRDQFIAEFLSDVVSHEVGHTLGLRHNFVASTNLTVAQLADPKITAREGITASVMDYTPVNTMAILNRGGSFYMPTIGAYDVWAIRYGYEPIAAQTPQGERFRLSQIASQSGMPGLAFMTDEDADAWNPFVVRFDQSKDPLEYSQKNLLVFANVRRWAVQELPKEGEPFWSRTGVLLQSVMMTFRESMLATRFLGGTVANRNFRGDRGERPTLAPVDAATQRHAMQLIVRYGLRDVAEDLPPTAILNMSRNFANGENSWNAPLRELLGMRQQMLLAATMGAATVDNIAENALKDEVARRPVYSVAEHYAYVEGGVFSEIGKDRNVGALRRDLQRFAINALCTQAAAAQGGLNEDARVAASATLRRLDVRFGAQLARSGSLDAATRLHLSESQAQIRRFLSRQVTGSR